MTLSKIEFAYDLFGYEQVSKGRISASVIDVYYEDWKKSLLSFKTWKNLRNTRG